ncbi:hypothetical protein AR457_25265 [Streptomyces agglomeratus]|uniref:Uncharacterized protein n=1 Tax=Streptomyces agglomeratus TaxID=285458 RepID=A0A1E5PCK5_9ACTN|nr:hypothetical protein [Streptomyces agglomeratus]OEJ27272.1 hypothetical protein AS594_25150 [Streptomyces agglomeratus]OEJ38675.1 hypothetical protein BGK70_11390 [Streptomyces agglomeratus]OEJ46941.1 hypothetical protein AR457_25265 [Streptomyces agglomeratus]OEJ51201.1 hypothetical protein BGK72_10870 [Streptomyces agglomeratus]OEJ58571.1 hypothetical protein BGM19_11780 [Streptomyces agglomeratus]
MGWAVLYIAFGVVALWLLGEVLLQYKARLRWRLLAFAGFMGVVLGVLMPSVFVIAGGAVAFAIGQTYVTLSFRRGFSTGWAIGGKPGDSRRRKRGARPVAQEPTLEVSDLEYEADASEYAPDVPAEPVFAPTQPLPDETGQYGVYDVAAYAAQQQAQSDAFGAGAGYGGYDTYSDYERPNQDTYTGQYDYQSGQQQYAAYSDPYIGTQQYGTQGYGTPEYGGQDYGTPQYGNDTPPGGVWVPQQRDGEQPFGGDQPAQEPYQGGYDTTGYNEQYRY